MRVYVAHLKTGGCPKGSRDVRAKGGLHRCRISGRRLGDGHGMYGSKKKK